MARAVLAGFFGSFPREHNLPRRYFLHPGPTVRYLSSRDESEFAQQAVAALRRTADRFPHDDRTRRLVARGAESRPSKVTSKALRVAFQRLDQRFWPFSVGSKPITVR